MLWPSSWKWPCAITALVPIVRALHYNLPMSVKLCQERGHCRIEFIEILEKLTEKFKRPCRVDQAVAWVRNARTPWHSSAFWNEICNPWQQSHRINKHTYCVYGALTHIASGSKWAAVKYMGPFIRANYTELQGGPHGPIPGTPPQKEQKTMHVNSKQCELGYESGPKSAARWARASGTSAWWGNWHRMRYWPLHWQPTASHWSQHNSATPSASLLDLLNKFQCICDGPQYFCHPQRSEVRSGPYATGCALAQWWPRAQARPGWGPNDQNCMNLAPSVELGSLRFTEWASTKQSTSKNVDLNCIF